MLAGSGRSVARRELRASLRSWTEGIGHRRDTRCGSRSLRAGREWHPKGEPAEVRVHDFVIPELGRAVPYGLYDIAGNAGWVSVGIDHDTAGFAINAIRSWWTLMGCQRYPNARSLTITADGGGSNGSRVRVRKRNGELRACREIIESKRVE